MTFRNLALSIAGLATALLLAACGGGTPTAASTQAIPTDAAPSVVEVPTFDLSTLDLPSFTISSFAGDEELEALLPDTIGGQVVVKQSMDGQSFLDLGMGGNGIEDTLADVGATVDDLSVAFGTAGTTVLIAYRIKGVSADRMFEGLQGALPSGAGSTLTERTVAGRTVLQATVGIETTYIYLSGDVVFVIGGTVTPELLEDTVSQLPAN